MRVLVVVPFPLNQEGSAAARCMLGLMQGLASHGVDALALTVDDRNSHLPGPPSTVAAEQAYVEYPRPWRARADRLLSPHAAFARGDFGRRVAELSAEVDVVHVYGIGTGALMRRIAAPAVAQLDSVTRIDRDIGVPWSRGGRITLEELRAERRTRRRVRWIVSGSPHVAAYFARETPTATARFAPLSLDPAFYPGRASLAEPIAGLIGTARWPPTANAVRRLLTRVWPRVLARDPTAQLRLAGHGMEPATFPDLPTLPGVHWLGTVPSAEAFLQSLGVLLYPLGRGTGAKVKVLESMLLGVPIVTTPPGAEGILGEGGLTVETDDDALASATCALLADADARRRAGEAGRRRFDAHHAPQRAAAPLLQLYAQMLA